MRTTILFLAISMVSFFTTAHAEIVQYGRMKEALAQGKSEGRIDLAELVKKPHFYGVGALEGLAGEVAVIDGEVITTQAATSQSIGEKPATTSTKATYLVGSYVTSWQSTSTTTNLTTSDLEKFLEKTATKQKLPKGQPFFFRVEGTAEKADLHVIRGACPMHARMKKIELSETQKAYEAKLQTSDVQIVGVFAKERVGDLTHPATSIHAHVIYKDASGQKINGHLENLVLAKGATVFVPTK